MKLTLASLHAEMKSEFAAVNVRINNLDKRIDHIITRLDGHIEDTNFRFREVNERFREVDRRFDEVDRRFDLIDFRFDELIKVIGDYSNNIARMLANHEERISALEAR